MLLPAAEDPETAGAAAARSVAPWMNPDETRYIVISGQCATHSTAPDEFCRQLEYTDVDLSDLPGDLPNDVPDDVPDDPLDDVPDDQRTAETLNK